MVVFPESGWEMMARLRRRSISLRGAANEEMELVAASLSVVSSAVVECSLVLEDVAAAGAGGRKASAPRCRLLQMHSSDRASKRVVVVMVVVVG